MVSTGQVTVDNKLIMTKKEAAVANCKILILSQNIPGRTKEYHEKAVRIIILRNSNRSQVIPNTEMTW
jgi:ribosomal protein L30E